MAPAGSEGRGAAMRITGGFTLLEVLGAVMILAIWLVVILSSGSTGIFFESRSLQRLEAAAIADQRLAELEAGGLDGSVPDMTEEVSEEGPFTVTVMVRPFVEPGSGGAAPPFPQAQAPDAPPPSLDPAARPGDPGACRRPPCVGGAGRLAGR